MLKVWFFHVFPCFPILFRLEKLTSLHIFFSLPTGTSWGSQPRRLPCRAALRWSAAFCWHLGPRNCGKDHGMGRSYRCFMLVLCLSPLPSIAHCCKNTFAAMLVRSLNLISKNPDSSGKTTAASAAFEDGELLLVPCESFADVGDITLLSGIRIQISVAPAVGG